MFRTVSHPVPLVAVIVSVYAMNRKYKEGME